MMTNHTKLSDQVVPPALRLWSTGHQPAARKPPPILTVYFWQRKNLDGPLFAVALATRKMENFKPANGFWPQGWQY